MLGYHYQYNFWYQQEMADIDIGMNLRRGISIWYQYHFKFRLSVPGFGMNIDLENGYLVLT